MIAHGLGFFQLLYAFGAVMFGFDIYHYLTTRKNNAQPAMRALGNTVLAVIVLLAVVELPFGFLITIPYVSWVVGIVAAIMIGRGVYKIYHLINPSSENSAQQPPKK